MAKNVIKSELTEILLNLQEKQIEYWQNRAERNFLAGEKDALQVAKDLKQNYKSTLGEIQNQIDAFYGKYLRQDKNLLQEAKQLLDRNEIRDFREYILEQIEEGKLSDYQLYKLDRLRQKAKIDRLEQLETNIDIELDRLTSKTEKRIHNLLFDSYKEAYYHTIYNNQNFIGFTYSFNGLNKKSIEKAIATKWLGDNYSSRIWKNERLLITTLEQELPRGLVLGYNPRKLAEQVSTKLNTNYNNNVRLIRTEYSKVLNDATLDGYKASRINKYKLLITLDNRTSDICQTLAALDETYNIDEAETGVNYPPFHPNCRTTTIPYFEPDEIDEMSDEELSKIGYITYDDWEKGLIKLEDNKVIYKKGVKIDE